MQWFYRETCSVTRKTGRAFDSSTGQVSACSVSVWLLSLAMSHELFFRNLIRQFKWHFLHLVFFLNPYYVNVIDPPQRDQCSSTWRRPSPKRRGCILCWRGTGSRRRLWRCRMPSDCIDTSRYHSWLKWKHFSSFFSHFIHELIGGEKTCRNTSVQLMWDIDI